MFGWHVSTQVSATKLVVHDPFSLGLLLAVFFAALLVYNKCRQRPFPRRSATVWAILLVLAFGLLPSDSTVTLDRTTATGTLSRYNFYHWTTASFPLDALDHAYLTTGATTERITLQFSDGHVASLSANDQMGGKPGAVFAINRFLGRT